MAGCGVNRGAVDRSLPESMTRFLRDLLLMLVYCLAVVPAGLAMRARRLDPMRRRRADRDASLWRHAGDFAERSGKSSRS